VRYDRFGIFDDLVDTSLSTGGTASAGLLDASATNEMVVGTPMGEFRAAGAGTTSLDVMVGCTPLERQRKPHADGTARPCRPGRPQRTWVDPMIGVKGRLQGTAPGKGLIGSFGVSSDIAWDALGAVGYEINDHFSVVAGHRALGVDYPNDGFVFDVAQHGPVVSGIVRF
jgi:hypothetical protein